MENIKADAETVLHHHFVSTINEKQNADHVAAATTASIINGKLVAETAHHHHFVSIININQHAEIVMEDYTVFIIK